MAKAKAAGLSLQQYVWQLLIQQLDEGDEPLYPKTRSEHDALEYLLENDPAAAESIKTNLRLITEAIERRRKLARARRAGGS